MDTPHLNPSDLYQRRKSKDASRLKAYNKILEQIYHRIRTISALHHSPCSLLYTVPPFILGLPKIDLEDCMIYLIYMLRHTGYEIRYTYPNMMYISWIHHESSYITQQSPIMQAMIASSEKSQSEIERNDKETSRLISARKSQRKVKIQTPGTFTQQSTSAIQHVLHKTDPMTPLVPPSASDYIPPVSFLQNIMNPSSNIPAPKTSRDYFK